MLILSLRSLLTGGVAPAVFDYYIGPSGSDSNSGTQGSPWAITAINTKAGTIAGKTVGLLDGTYSLYSLATDGDYNQPALQVPSGSAGIPTVIAAVNSRLAHLTLNSGASRPANGNPAIGRNGGTGYITIRGLKVSGGLHRGIQFYHATPQTMTGLTVEDCEVYDIDERDEGASGANVSGIRLEGCRDSTIRNNKVYTVYEGGGGHNGACIELFGSLSCIVEKNSLSDAVAGIYVKQSNNASHTARFNFINGITEALLGWDFGGSSTTHTIHNNVILGANNVFAGDFNYVVPSNLDIYNNTITSDANGFSACGWQVLTATGKLDFYNNIIVHSAAAGAFGDLAANIDGPGILDYNCYPASSLRLVRCPSGLTSPTVYTSLAAYQAAMGKDAASIADDPEFTGSGSGPAAYQLGGSSPCKSTGKSNGTSGGSNVDMGAWGGASPPAQIGCDH